MKNQLIDLNNHLFTQLERLNEEGLGGDNLKSEIKRSQAMSSLAHSVIDNARLALDAEKAKEKDLVATTPAMIGNQQK